MAKTKTELGIFCVKTGIIFYPINMRTSPDWTRGIYSQDQYKARTSKNIIHNFKNKAPGSSEINKLILSNLPDNAIDRYSLLTNLTLSMGYYPTAFKKWSPCICIKAGQRPETTRKLPSHHVT